MVSRVYSFELGVHGLWFRSYGVPGFESTGYIVSRVLGYVVSHYPSKHWFVEVREVVCCIACDPLLKA